MQLHVNSAIYQQVLLHEVPLTQVGIVQEPYGHVQCITSASPLGNPPV